MIIGIQHSAIPVRDMEKSSEFYAKVLGFREGFRVYAEDGSLTTIFMHVIDRQFLELQHVSLKKDEPFPSNGFHMSYEVDDVTAMAAYIVSQGVPLSREIKKGKSGCLQTFIADPDGHRIELMQVLPDSLQGQACERFKNQRCSSMEITPV